MKRKPVTMSDIRKAQGDVCRKAILFDARWEGRALTDSDVWEAANDVAHAARRLYRLSMRYAKAHTPHAQRPQKEPKR